MTNIIKNIESVTALGTACVVTSVICAASIPMAVFNGVKVTVNSYAEGLKKMYKEEKKKASYTVNWINVD